MDSHASNYGRIEVAGPGVEPGSPRKWVMSPPSSRYLIPATVAHAEGFEPPMRVSPCGLTFRCLRPLGQAYSANVLPASYDLTSPVYHTGILA